MSLLRRRALLGNNSSVDFISGSVLYSDGTFIVNEKTKDRPNNIILHGSVVEEAPLITASNNNPWNSLSESNRSTVSKIEFGSRVSLTKYKFSITSSYYTSVVFDATNIDTSNVTDMSSMFYGCDALTSLDLSSFDTSSVTIMDYMFSGCKALTSVDLSSFDTSNVTNMSSMFQQCLALTTIYASSDFVVSQVTSSNLMFYNCSQLVGGSGTVYNSSRVIKTYARIDNPPDYPGYFTLKSA